MESFDLRLLIIDRFNKIKIVKNKISGKNIGPPGILI